MSVIFRISLIISEGIAIYFLGQTMEYLNMTLLDQIIYALLGFCFILFLEYCGVNHKICNFISSIFKGKLNRPKKEQEFISFKEALDYVIAFRDRTHKYLDILCSSENSHAHDFYSLNYSCFKEGGLTIVGTDMYSLLNLIRGKLLNLYGQKTLTISSLCAIDLSTLDETLYWAKENWSEELNTLYNANSKDILYTNLCIKKADIKALIKRSKII